MSQADLQIRWWQMDAGLRFLRSISPEIAEYEYAHEIEHRRLVQALIANGKLDKYGAYNLVRSEATGKKRNITFFPDGSARSWRGETPQEFRSLPTIEPRVSASSSLRSVISFLNQVAESLPEPVGNEARSRLSKIEAQRAPISLLSDVFPLTTRSQSPEETRLRAQIAIVILDFLDALAPSSGGVDALSASVEKFAVRCKNAYANARLSGVLYWPLLFLLEVVEVASPTWPFGKGLPTFVCGQLSCSHRICRENIQSFRRGNAPTDASLASRDLFAYLLTHEAELSALLDVVIATSGNTMWIAQAARNLLSRGEGERAKLAKAQAAWDFYTLHFRFLPFFKAAQLGFQFLASRTNGEETDNFEKLMNGADELGARSIGALQFDFLNSVDFAPVANLRAVYLLVAKDSGIAANNLLQKWVYDESIIPEFWSDYVSGKVEGLQLRRSS